MMHFFQTMKKDIANGVNLDIYATMAVCAVVAVTSLLGLTKVEITASAILACTLLLTIGRASDREALKDIRDCAHSQRTVFFHFHDSDYATRIKNATEIRMVSLANYRFLAANASSFHEFLRKGGVLKSIFLWPDDALNSFTAAARAYGASRNPAHIKIQVGLTMDKLREFRQLAPDPKAVLARHTKYVTSCVLTWISSPDSDEMFLSLPGFSQSTDTRPTLVISKKNDPGEFLFFAAFFENLWNWDHTRDIDDA